jgi:tryptophan-rich sensory protein
MSIRDLRKMGLLKPESEWTERLPRSNVSVVWTIVWTTIALAGCVLMVQGNGGTMTWVGLICFVVALGSFVRLNIQSVQGGGLE